MAAATLLTAAFLTAFALVPQPPYGANPFQDGLRRHLLVAGALFIWASLLLLHRRLPRPNPLVAPLVLLLIAEAAASALSPDWRIGVEPVLDVLSALLILCLFVDCPGLSSDTLRRALMLSSLALAAACLYFVLGRWLDWLALARVVPEATSSILPPTVPRVLGIGTNPNIIAPLMTLTAPLYLLSIVRSHGPRRVALIGTAVLIQLATFFTLSRAAWVGEAAGLSVSAAGLLLSTHGLRSSFRRVGAVASAGAIGAIALGALTVALGWRPLWLFRPSFIARSDFRAAAVQMIRSHPLFGAGPGSFPLNYPLVSSGEPAGAVHSHNILLQLGVDGGVVGLAAAGLIAATTIFLLRRLWKNGGGGQRALAVCIAGALVGFVIGGMGDALHLFPEILFVVGGLLAIAIRADRETSAAPAAFGVRRISILECAMAAMSLVFGLGLLAAWGRIDQAGHHYEHSISLASEQHWIESASEARTASRLDPAMPAYAVQAGVALGIAAETLPGGDPRLSGNAEAKTAAAALRRQAIASLELALRMEPRSAPTQFEVAALLEAGGQEGQAAALLPAIRSAGLRDTLLMLGAGAMGESADQDRATEDYATAMADSPRVVDSPFWRENDFRQQQYPQIVSRALVIAGREDASSGSAAARAIIADGTGVSLEGETFVGDIDRARWNINQGDNRAAGEILGPALRERPDDPAVRLALGELYAAQGELPRARAQWLAGAYLGDAASIRHLGDTSPGGQVPPKIIALGRSALDDLWIRPLSVTQQHYRFAFRRREPLPIILPGDWLNGLPRVYTDLEASVQRWDSSPHGAASTGH